MKEMLRMEAKLLFNQQLLLLVMDEFVLLHAKLHLPGVPKVFPHNQGEAGTDSLRETV